MWIRIRNTARTVSKLRIRIFFPFWISDAGVKKSLHPGSGSATLIHSEPLDANQCCGCILFEFGLGYSFEFRLFRESGSWFPRIQIQALMTKNIKIIFLIKIAIYIFLLIIEGLPSYRRSPQPSKETIIKFFTFFLFGSFYLPGFGS
jgi:hypothetical protein